MQFSILQSWWVSGFTAGTTNVVDGVAVGDEGSLGDCTQDSGSARSAETSSISNKAIYSGGSMRKWFWKLGVTVLELVGGIIMTTSGILMIMYVWKEMVSRVVRSISQLFI